ncbi:bestrophin-like domain [Streptomyces sp. NPDC054804]
MRFSGCCARPGLRAHVALAAQPLQHPHAGRRHRRRDRSAGRFHLQDAFRVLQTYDPKSEQEQVFYEQAVGHLDDVACQRRARITMARQQLPPLLQALAVGGALVLVPLTFLYGMRKLRVQILFVASVAGLVGFSLLLVFVLDRPFAGDLSVSPTPYREGALARYWTR